MTISILLERTDDLLQKLYQCLPDPNPTLLFESTELANCAEQSPIWVDTTNQTSMLELMRGSPEAWPGLIIESHASQNAMLSHLRHILIVRFGGERKGALRYSIPTTASYFFTVNNLQTSRTWMGPISRLSWYGGTWRDLALGTQQWFNVENPDAQKWQHSTERPPLHLDQLQEQSLQRQQKDHFVYLWWKKQADVSFNDAVDYLNQGIANGFVEAQELEQYLTLRSQHPSHTAPVIPLDNNSEDRLELLRQQLARDHQDKESLT
ncbi:DUF4123 domain-containing protein [Pseudomonas sp. ANT_J12]|nr:DUF4123 domain-containing protein [Pseudomonas sp. ANT_J12]KAA0994669.1 DUF4123 domain-containing protein [Pseudomonas sp. ANT_J12]